MAIGITNAGGGNAWAMVLVNYPSGSTLTATNVSGKKDISATQRLYYVKKPSGSTQTCVLTITDGTQTKSETVSGITVGTARTITLSYALVIYDNGEKFVEIGGYQYNYNYSGGYVENADNITIGKDNTYNFGVSARTVNNINTGEYNSLCVDAYRYGNSTANDCKFGLATSNSTYLFDVASADISSTRMIHTIDISSFHNRSLCVGLGGLEGNRDTASTYIKIYKVWLE